MTAPSTPPPDPNSSYLILGAGPAGLTMAKMLQDRGVQQVTLLEASEKVGGKCLSSEFGDHVVEFGTCYAIWSHHYVLKQMKALGIRRNFLKAQRIDDRELLDYIKDGRGPLFAYQVVKYLWLRSRLMAKADANDPKTNEALAKPTGDWLREHNLGKIERMMHRVVTSIGYGYLNRLPLIHAMRWVDFDMLVTGLIKYTVMPEGGWQNFWNRFADSLDVKLNQAAVEVRRGAGGVTVRTADGFEYSADYLINTIPVNEFCQLTNATAAERHVADSINWGGYTTTLVSVIAWDHNAPVNAWSETCATDANDGQILFSRFECPNEDGRLLFTVGQLSAAFNEDELTEMALYGATKHGALDPQMMQQSIWSYMPTYSSESVRNGLISKMASMQGEARTFHSGASFSHEAVSTISSFNRRLIAQVMT